jgi:hypothetical protein
LIVFTNVQYSIKLVIDFQHFAGRQNLFITSIVDLVRQSTLDPLGDSLLDALWDNRVLTVVKGVGLATSSGAGIMYLRGVVSTEDLGSASMEHGQAYLVGQGFLETLRRFILDSLWNLGATGSVGGSLATSVLHFEDL